jgi:hypothetical protein
MNDVKNMYRPARKMEELGKIVIFHKTLRLRIISRAIDMVYLSLTAGQPWLKKTAIVGGSVASLLTLWLIGGNLLAAQREKTTQKDWTELTKRFPAKASNTSAKELDRLVAKLGLPPLIVQEGAFLTASLHPAEDKKLRNFAEYLKEQIAKPNHSIDTPTPDLQQYYDKRVESIAAIRQYLLKETSPQWEQKELKRYLSANEITSYLNLVYLNNLLTFDALQNIRKGQSQTAYDSMKASWKLSQSLYDRPDSISHLVAKITETSRIGVLRKIDRLPRGWQTELKSANAGKQFLKALELNSFKISELYLQNFPRWNDPLEGATGYPLGGKGSDSISARSSQFLLNPYFRFAALDYQANIQPVLTGLPTKSLCTFAPEAIAEINNASASWWNPMRWHSNTYENMTPEMMQYWLIIKQPDIHWELTEKLQQVKQIARQTGKLPQQIPGFESSAVCPELRWTYRPAGQGEAEIALEKTPVWLNQDGKGLPLQFKVQNLRP